MTPEERYALAMQVIEWLLDKKGQRIYIRETITDRDFDRHGTSNVWFSMILEDAVIRFSGARAMLSGTENEFYEFAIDNIEGTISTEKLELIEVLCKKNEHFPLLRRTIINLKIS